MAEEERSDNSGFNRVSGGGVLLITWDEAARGRTSPHECCRPLRRGSHYSNNTYYTHGSTLRTLQEIFEVYPLIRNAGSATDLRSLFSVFP